MKNKVLALLAILLASFAVSEAKAVSKKDYCHTLLTIIANMDEEQMDYEMSRDYGVYDAYFDHCLGN